MLTRETSTVMRELSEGGDFSALRACSFASSLDWAESSREQAHTVAARYSLFMRVDSIIGRALQHQKIKVIGPLFLCARRAAASGRSARRAAEAHRGTCSETVR